MNIFLDDLRQPPEGFIRATNVADCQELLLTGEVDILCLDNGLGPGKPTGGDLAKWMVNNRIPFPKEIYVHTGNYAERLTIKTILKHYVDKYQLDTKVFGHPYGGA